MVKRYYEKKLISARAVNIFECPDCGFEFNAMHEVDEQVGGWECPLCEVDELKKEIETLNKRYELLADYKHTIDRAKMTLESEMLSKTKLHM